MFYRKKVSNAMPMLAAVSFFFYLAAFSLYMVTIKAPILFEYAISNVPIVKHLVGGHLGYGIFTYCTGITAKGISVDLCKPTPIVLNTPSKLLYLQK